ncbi:ATP-binding cassette domain-containing protein [Embleya scabrispora]|uniref:ATP-binding cassette domain-containing protein n=1 Tax=Embleya scabrispora TaxID=159449 RepID=UPI000373874A|nr:excinuclease ABC subunit UvrA [Embleya scabrispora]MYS79442.1 ATP-binding cassette domain-containing protein [Streptomyces sp. SID5474]
MINDIVITGARENNLKDVSLRIPKDRIVVFTGPSGSGKSSIVFDTVAVESKRQLNETFSAFERKFLPRYERPHADAIENVSPAIVVDQKPIGSNSRSTVGTMTDINPLLRVLFSRVAEPSAGTPRVYSFNDPGGMCTTCDGIGRTVRADYTRLLDRSKSLNDGAFVLGLLAVGLYQASGLFDNDKPIVDYTDAEFALLTRGDPNRVIKFKWVTSDGTANVTFEGLYTRFDRLYVNRDVSTLSAKTRETVETYLTEGPCPDCAGARLNPAVLAARIDGRNIADFCALEVGDLIEVLAGIDDPIGGPVAEAASAALRRIVDIGLSYLSLDRETSTLSGGEGQRLKMVRHLGSSLTGMTYIFDEPSVGLHPRDVHRLNELLVALRDKGNSVLVVEHDPDVIAVADHVIDMGPHAGSHGGELVFAGTVKGLIESDTLTGRFLNRGTVVKTDYRTPTGHIPIRGAHLHNLKHVDVDIPTGVLTVFTGVAGSGKSTLVSEVFAGAHPDTIVIDQSAIAANSRSTPASHIGIMDPIRALFAKANGEKPGLFSFNSAGACPACQGRGSVTVEMAFMDPVTTICERCEGRRFDDKVLGYPLRGKSIIDVLTLTVEDAHEFFTEKRIRPHLAALAEVGLGYVTLGQPLGTLSGGERQRLKLAGELHKTGSVYVLDEPTTGLHMSDVDIVIALMDRLVDGGNTLLVIEHNLDVVGRADWVIDLGPDGGKHGGTVVFEGTPEQLLAAENSLTGEYLRRNLDRDANRH